VEHARIELKGRAPAEGKVGEDDEPQGAEQRARVEAQGEELGEAEEDVDLGASVQGAARAQAGQHRAVGGEAGGGRLGGVGGHAATEAPRGVEGAAQERGQEAREGQALVEVGGAQSQRQREQGRGEQRDGEQGEEGQVGRDVDGFAAVEAEGRGGRAPPHARAGEAEDEGGQREGAAHALAEGAALAYGAQLGEPGGDELGGVGAPHLGDARPGGAVPARELGGVGIRVEVQARFEVEEVGQRHRSDRTPGRPRGGGIHGRGARERSRYCSSGMRGSTVTPRSLRAGYGASTWSW
jgi:hypothetical protein